MTATATVRILEDPDEVAPYLEVGKQFDLVRSDEDGITIQTEWGSLVRAKRSKHHSQVFRFGAVAFADTRAAHVSFEENNL